ncbi:MAG: DUF4214 domain-containing protein [Acidimicrobiales bacterium]|nr:DUF4214 domain-containing protein [Acidimicrobiales bacterium]
MRKCIFISVLFLAGLLGTSPTLAEVESGRADTSAPGPSAVHKEMSARYVSTFRVATTLEELQFAPDFKPEHANLLRLYQAYFNRGPGLKGAKYWVTTWEDVKAEGATAQRPAGHDYLGEFADLFTDQPEFQNTYGDADNAEFLSRVYNNMLGRAPDQKGYDYWLSFLNGTNTEQPGVVLSKGATVRWVTRSPEFVNRYPFGHTDLSDHPSDNANCVPGEVTFQGTEITGIYRLRDGGIRELCWGVRNIDVEGAWGRLAQVAEPTHFSPVVLLGVYQGNGAGIVAYAGPTFGANNTYIGDLWLISAQDVATRNDPIEADLTMAHELSHVFTQLDAQYQPWQSSPCSTYEAYSFDSDGNGSIDTFGCYTPTSYLNQWVGNFWSQDELANAGNRDALCVDGHDFISSYATTSPEEDLAESFSGYVYSANVSNQGAKFAFFDSKPELKAYRDRAQSFGWTGYTGSLDQCP